MKIKAITAALALVALCGLNMSAQRPERADRGAKCTQTEATCTKDAKCDTAACYGPYSEIFAGLNLTADQQNALKAIKPERPSKQDRQARAQAVDSIRQAARADREQKNREYLNKVKQVLTPEQYVTFLEEIVITNPGAPKGGPRQAQKMTRGDRKHKMHATEGRRFDKQGRPNKFDKQARKAQKARTAAPTDTNK